MKGERVHGSRGFWDKARRPRIAERSARDMSVFHHPPVFPFPFGWFKETLCRFNFTHPPHPVQFPMKLR